MGHMLSISKLEKKEKKRETRYMIRVAVKIYIHEVDLGIGLVKLRCPIIGCNP